MKKIILVTGGAGYIGSHTSVELVQAGYGVVMADNFYNSSMSVVDGVCSITGKDIPFEEVDCTDKAEMERLFGKYKFDAVIHFAAYKAVGESVEKPLGYYANNVGSMITLLEAMRGHGVSKLVFSSSCTVYGQPDVLPVTENSPRKEATSPYGNTKRICEDIMRDSIAAYDDLAGVALRYFNPVGAHPSALIGEMPKGVPNNLVPFITQTAAGVREELRIFGDDYNTPDGTNQRDYIDIVDLARAHVKAIDRMLGGKMKSHYEIFNVGTGTPVSVLEMIRSFEKANGLEVNYKIAGRRAGDVEAVWADTTLANRELGWKATRTLEDTLRGAWEWEKRIRNIK